MESAWSGELYRTLKNYEIGHANDKRPELKHGPLAFQER